MVSPTVVNNKKTTPASQVPTPAQPATKETTTPARMGQVLESGKNIAIPVDKPKAEPAKKATPAKKEAKPKAEAKPKEAPAKKEAKPKAEAKPKTTAKPKAEEKPKAEAKPKKEAPAKKEAESKPKPKKRIQMVDGVPTAVDEK
jgi:membrane protein involved in colicin uptake